LADRVWAETPQPPVLGKEMITWRKPGKGGLVFFFDGEKVSAFGKGFLILT